MADWTDDAQEISERERWASIARARKAAAEDAAKPQRFACADGCGDSVVVGGPIRCAWCHEQFLRKQARGIR